MRIQEEVFIDVLAIGGSFLSFLPPGGAFLAPTSGSFGQVKWRFHIGIGVFFTFPGGPPGEVKKVAKKGQKVSFLP